MDHREANLRKKVWKYAAALQAMAQAGSMAEARRNLGRGIDGAVHDGFMDAIATCYSRPFTNNGDGAVGALDKQLERDIDSECESTHRLLAQHRMTTAAHSDPRIGLAGSERLARDLTLLVTRLPDDGINIGHSLPCFRIDYEHLDAITALVANVKELLYRELDTALSDLFYDEEANCMKDPVASVWRNLQEGETASIPLNLHEAINYNAENKTLHPTAGNAPV